MAMHDFRPSVSGGTDTLWEALVAALAGFFLLFVSLHVLNGLARVSAQFARVMLGSPQERS